MVSCDDENHEMTRLRGPRTPITAFAGFALILLTASTAAAGASGNMNKDGVDTSVTQVVVDRANKGLDLQTGEPDPRVFEYASTTACQLSLPGGPGADALCVGAVQACAGNTPASGLPLYPASLPVASSSSAITPGNAVCATTPCVPYSATLSWLSATWYR